MRSILILIFFTQLGFCQKPDRKGEMKIQIDKLTCSEIGINGIREIITKYKTPSEDIEKKQVKNKDFKNLYLHNLVYPYGVARKYYIHWIPKEELIDESIIGFRKGLKKYLEQERDFRVGEYVVFWCQRLCIEKLIRSIWELGNKYEKRNIPKSDIEKIISKIKDGKTGHSQFLKEHYLYLFEEIDKKYFDLQPPLNEEMKDNVIKRAIDRDFSLEELKEEQYENHRNRLSFEDIILLEYSLAHEEKIKASR